LADLAAFGKKKSQIKGTHRLLHKESNRAQAIQKEFGKLGIQVELDGDSMIIHPGKVTPGTVDAHNDHRIAMACAILGLKGGPVTIQGAECVSKSYPEFFDHLQDLGAVID
jgi:3-phosphoshikimate 1-carboxyvinyltransferase